MARIDFAFGATERVTQACQTSLRQYLAGQPLIVYCTDSGRLKAFDQKLWAVDEAAFVPHVAADDPEAADTPIWLVSSDLPSALARAPAKAWLLNLDDDCPPGIDNVPRILEIVSDDDADKAAARERWRMYQAAGHDVKSFRLSAV
jgi:DNA polymerase III subunit chi